MYKYIPLISLIAGSVSMQDNNRCFKFKCSVVQHTIPSCRMTASNIAEGQELQNICNDRMVKAAETFCFVQHAIAINFSVLELRVNCKLL